MTTGTQASSRTTHESCYHTEMRNTLMYIYDSILLLSSSCANRHVGTIRKMCFGVMAFSEQFLSGPNYYKDIVFCKEITFNSCNGPGELIGIYSYNPNFPFSIRNEKKNI